MLPMSPISLMEEGILICPIGWEPQGSSMEFIGAHWMAIGWSRTIDHDQLVTDKGRFTNSNESGSPGTVGPIGQTICQCFGLSSSSSHCSSALWSWLWHLWLFVSPMEFENGKLRQMSCVCENWRQRRMLNFTIAPSYPVWFPNQMFSPMNESVGFP